TMATAFETEMGVMPELSKAVSEMDWILPTDIQGEAVPLILGGGDVLMAAETGSGKTGAFCLPVLQIVYETLKDASEGKSSGKSASASEAANSNTAAAQKKHWRFNMHDRTEQLAIDAEGVLVQSRHQRDWHGARAVAGVKSRGKYYFEATVTDEGLARIGWATAAAKLDLGTDGEGYGYGGTGKKSHHKQFDTYGESFILSDTIGCFIDLDKGEIAFSKNGKLFGKAFDIDAGHRSAAFFPCVCLKNAELRVNFGLSEFKHPPPKPFVAVCQAAKDCVALGPSSSSGSQSSSASPPKNAPLAIIIEPSRELAEQTLDQLRKFKRYLTNPSPTELLIIGGQAVKEQLDSLRRGVDIVVATPGRLKDLIDQGALSLQACRLFVLDECDGLLSAGYGSLIDGIHRAIPKVTADGRRLQMVVCSATLHAQEVRRMAERLMYFPVWIDLKGQDSVADTIHHCVCPVDPLADQSWRQLLNKNTKSRIQTDGVHLNDRVGSSDSPETLSEAVKLLKGEYVIRAIEKHNMDRCLIFCRTKLDCDNLEHLFITKGGGPRARKGAPYSCVCLHSDRKPQERKDNLERFKNADVRFLICTDVAARGIDISGLPFVINVTLPDEKQNYVHRIGRVGRAERMGLAISLVANVKEKVWYHSNCQTKGRGCTNTNLVEVGGCCICTTSLNC
ncbi:hypothetical protein BOX15_Mlig022248g3, partial [Macrostomum lignano]